MLADAGHTPQTATATLRMAAESLSQAVLVRDSAFERLAESGGPLSASGRARRAFTAWLQATDRVERHLRLLGLERKERNITDLARALSGVGE